MYVWSDKQISIQALRVCFVGVKIIFPENNFSLTFSAVWQNEKSFSFQSIFIYLVVWKIIFQKQ